MWKDWDWLCTPYSKCGERKLLDYLCRLSLGKLKQYLIHVYLLVCIYKCFYVYTLYTQVCSFISIRHFDIICIMYLNFSIPKHLVNRHYTHSTGPMFINVLRSYIHLKYTCIIYIVWSNLIDMIYLSCLLHAINLSNPGSPWHLRWGLKSGGFTPIQSVNVISKYILKINETHYIIIQLNGV